VDVGAEVADMEEDEEVAVATEAVVDVAVMAVLTVIEAAGDPEEVKADTVTAVVEEGVAAAEVAMEVAAEDLEEAGVCMMTVVEMVVMSGVKSFHAFLLGPFNPCYFDRSHLTYTRVHSLSFFVFFYFLQICY